MLTSINDVQVLVQEFWSPLFVPELMETSVLPYLVNKDYSGEIRKLGDKVKVSSLGRPTAQRKTSSDANHNTFEVGKLTPTQVEVEADQIITAGYEFDSLVEIQSQLGDADSEIRRGIVEAMMIEVNNYLYSLVAPSTSAPDHTTTGVSDFNATQLGAVRTLASQAKWSRNKGWWLLLDPQFHTDLLGVAALTSKDYAPDAPVVGGQFAVQRYGFNILEDNSAGMAQISPTAATSDLALAFHPDFLYFVTQLEPQFEISSLHSQKQHGFLITAKMVVGGKLGIEGADKHITVVNA